MLKCYVCSRKVSGKEQELVRKLFDTTSDEVYQELVNEINCRGEKTGFDSGGIVVVCLDCFHNGHKKVIQQREKTSNYPRSNDRVLRGYIEEKPPKSLFGDLFRQTVVFGDCTEVLRRFRSGFFHLIITSPPYNLGINYPDWNDSLSLKDYFKFCQSWLSECYRVLVSGGRLCLNISFSTKNCGNMLFEYITILRKIGFMDREMIVWSKKRESDNGFVCKPKLFGSVASPKNPFIRSLCEMIIVMSKESKQLKGMRNRADITLQEYTKWTKNVWEFDTEGDRRHPAPFPCELPKRLIKLYSYKGNKVLDPFAGRGTTLKAAQKLGRVGFGIELSKKYLPLIRETVGSNLKVIGEENLRQKVMRKSYSGALYESLLF